MFVEALQAFITADAGVSGLMGTAATRSDKKSGLFPTEAPSETVMPYIVMQQVGGNPQATSMAGTNKLQYARWRFSCYGSTYMQAKKLSAALKNSLNGCGGTMPAGNAEVTSAFLVLEADESEAIPHGTIKATHVDYEFTFVDNDA